MADFTPAPGTRVTVDGREWEFASRPGSPFLSWWYGESNCGVSRRPLLDRIAELEELVEHFKRLKDDQINECLKALAESRADMARLARYEALGKEAGSISRDMDNWEIMGKSCELADKLAAEWRAQQEGR